MRIVVDTNVFVAALRGGSQSASRHLFRRILQGQLQPVMSATLLLEHLDVLGRTDLWAEHELSLMEREHFLDAYLSYCDFHRIHFRWRPNLRDEGDNHLVELAVAAQVRAIITHNLRDFAQAELSFGGLDVMPPAELLQRIRKGE